MYKFQFLVPEKYLESVKTACFNAGAGTIGPYEQCAWQTLGIGQYLPLSESNPHQGTPGTLETAQEYLVDMVIEDDRVKTVIEAFLKAHPYETPAYGVWKIVTLKNL